MSHNNNRDEVGVIDLVDSSSDEEGGTSASSNHGSTVTQPTDESYRVGKPIVNPYAKLASKIQRQPLVDHPKNMPPGNANHQTRNVSATGTFKRKRIKAPPMVLQTAVPILGNDAFVVLEEDLDDAAMMPSRDNMGGDQGSHWQLFSQQQQERRALGQQLQLYTDPDFGPVPASIRGTKQDDKKDAPILCRCRGNNKLAKLSFQNKTDKPYYQCASKSCNFFRYAYQPEQMHWYRFGSHTGHVLVSHTNNGTCFYAQDLVQGKVGDCWFLSALAVVAERPDLIRRLFPTTTLHPDGMVQVRLFLDGYWKVITMDNFLPCLVDDQSEKGLQKAILASLGEARTVVHDNKTANSSSLHDPYALADQCRPVLLETARILDREYQKLHGGPSRFERNDAMQPLKRLVTSQDLAYSKARNNQLWVPFLEKAYAKAHGCYQAISGGHIAEAFLDLTGAPTQVYDLHAAGFDPRSFWYRLLQFRKQRLPMGCGTSSSAVGIIGMHAYSILDVREIKNVDWKFFQETGVAHGNVSGFTEYDGTVRLLRIRNPHGQGEWKGDFSDRSAIWEKLLQYSAGKNNGLLERTMKNDGTFWIDYDNFLLAFSNVDVVLAFLGNHGKSFPSNFASKTSNHRCVRAFEVSLIDPQPGVPSRDNVEIYVMGIQKTRRGARSGRTDRKVSYKVSDLGMLVGHGYSPDNSDGCTFSAVRGQMFGFNRNGHQRLILDRKTAKSLVVMPVSFGHPAASDKELPFVLRFVSDAPLLIRELPAVPRMDVAFQHFCLSPLSQMTSQGMRTILFQDSLCRVLQVDCRANGGGTILLYLCMNEDEINSDGISFSVEVKCRGMSCRTEEGLQPHETLAKGKKFEAAWRLYKNNFVSETKSRLLLVVYQSGQDTEFGSIVCKRVHTLGTDKSTKVESLDTFIQITPRNEYNVRGIFNPPDTPGTCAWELSTALHAKKIVSPSHYPLVYDIEDHLERALAESRGSLELQQAIEASRSDHQASQVDEYDIQQAIAMSLQHNNPNDFKALAKNDDVDDELQRVLGMSKQEAIVHTFPSVQAIGSLTTSFEDDLSRAVKLSLMDTTNCAASPKTVHDKDDVMAILDTPPYGSMPKKAKIEKDRYNMEKDGKPVDPAEKRRLVAEAAMKRLGSLSST